MGLSMVAKLIHYSGLRHVLDQTDQPGARAENIFHATGKRIRALPVTPDKLPVTVTAVIAFGQVVNGGHTIR